MSLISIPRLREELNFSEDNDASLIKLRKIIESLWNNQTSRVWEKETDRVEILRPRRKRRSKLLFLKLFPVTSFTLVEDKYIWQDDTQYVEITNYTPLYRGDYMIGVERFAPVTSSQIPLAEFNYPGINLDAWNDVVRVTYSGGFDEDEAPEEILHALIIQAQFILERYSQGRVILKQQNLENATANYEKGTVHPEFHRIAFNWRMHR